MREKATPDKSSETKNWRDIAQFNALVAYWDNFRKANDGIIIDRNNIRPQDIKSFLSWTFIAETRGHQNLTVCLSATPIDELLGINLSGSNMFDRYIAAHKEAYWAYFSDILSGKFGGYTNRILVDKWNQQVRYRSLYLPLRNKDGSSTALIGAIHATEIEQDIERRLNPPEEKAEDFSRINEICHLELEAFEQIPFDFNKFIG